MKLSGGYVSLARVRGVPLRLHLALPLVAFAMGRGKLAPGLWGAYLAVILVHTLGHAAAAWRLGLRSAAVEVSPIGGRCLYAPPAGPIERAITAWAGPLAQMLLLALALIVFRVVPPEAPWAVQVREGLLFWNLGLAVLNLLPLPRLDGHEAWRIFGLLRRGARPMHATPPTIPVVEVAPPRPVKRPVIQVIRARSASELLRELDAQEDRGNVPDVRDLVEEIFRKARQNKRDLPN